ncbi:UDP-N-acetylglucosamine pyrophosphorylase, partial [Candidatus Magnetoovum chiemensis]
MSTAAVILAAGLGTRMKSATPKLLHKILGKPIISYVVEAVRQTQNIETIVVVISKHSENIKDCFSNNPDITIAYQHEPLGTADALKAGITQITKNFDYTITLAGDTPLIKSSTLNYLLEEHINSQNDLTALSFIAQNPTSYGRIVRNSEGSVKGIIEEKDANDKQKEIKEVNSGIYVFN